MADNDTTREDMSSSLLSQPMDFSHQLNQFMKIAFPSLFFLFLILYIMTIYFKLGDIEELNIL